MQAWMKRLTRLARTRGTTLGVIPGHGTTGGTIVKPATGNPYPSGAVHRSNKPKPRLLPDLTADHPRVLDASMTNRKRRKASHL